jgi:hypothetical protein
MEYRDNKGEKIMEAIIIRNATKEWLKCIDVFDYLGHPIGDSQGINIPPHGEKTVRSGSGDPTKKITIMIGMDQESSD